MPLPTAEENLRDYNRAVKRKETFNLESMANTIFNNLPSSYRQQSLYNYQQYFTAHTNELNGRSVQRAAEDALRAEVYNAVYQRAVDYQMPKSKTEFLMRKIADQPLISPYMAMDMAAASMTHSWGMNAAEIDAMGQYGQQHRALDITGTVLNMAFDPTTYVSGGVGSFVGKQGLKLAGKQMIKGASKELAERYAARTLTGRVIGGVAGGAANFATYEALKNIQGQMAVGGVVNPETGEREFSFGEVLKAGGHGLVLGGVTGAFSPIIGNVADKYVKATTSTAGKVAVRTGELATSTLAEGTIFSAYDIYENSKLADGDPNKRSNWDIWSDSMAMMLGFKASHMVKSAPQYIASLRPIKPTNGRPLTQAERNHNRMNFEERLRQRMDMSPRDLDFTKDERDELRRAGYGELADLFSRDRFETQNPNINPADGAVELRAERVEAETIHRSPEFDGYSAMEELMQDSRVSQNARAKAYFILTGRMLPMGTVMAYNTQQAEDGSFIVNSVTSDGEVVTSRRFASEREAQGEIDNINRQVELNTIDVGERYRDAEANEAVFMAAVNEVSRGADPQAIRQIYEAVKRGDENVTESQRQLVEFLDEAIKRNAEAGAEHRPEAIRERLNKETGLDVDKALRKQPKDRTEEEQALVERYARELFPEQKQEEQYEPSPEQAEADRMYEESRLLYGRFEQGDPTAQADIDAIALRMQEAYQMCEDAFGAEAEYWMYHVNENPWSLINDPSLTPDQQEAVLYYINSKAALDGVMDASHEASQRKREQVEQEVAGRTHKERGVIIPAVMKVDDKPAYIIKGDVAMYPDGSGVDAANSSESIVIIDESGEYKFVSPDQIYKVGESIDPQDELQTAYAQIDAEQESVFGVDVPPEPEAPAEPVPEPAAPAPDAEAPQQPIADTKEYDRAYEQGLEEAAKADDAWIANLINIYSQNTPESMSEAMKGQLDAYRYEQQRRQMEPQNAPAEVAGNNGTENIPQNGNIGAENIPAPEPQAETALSRIPFNEEKQDYEFTAVEPETAWDGLVEAMEGEANAVPIAQQMIADANKRMEALNKKPPTPAKPKLAGKAGPMAMRAEQKRVDDENAKAQAEYQQALADAQAEAQAWSNILRVYTDRNAELHCQHEEERRRRDAEAHDAAVARFEEEQRIKAEKQAEQERIGVHAVNPKIRERWEAAPKVEGNEDALTLPDGSTITGRYVLTEAGAASPSHDANNAYAPTEGFPIDENGQSVNDRDYQRDKDAQRIVEDIAGSYDNRALQDPVIVSKDGVVLSGNNRTMSGDLAARQGTDKAYNDYLAKFGHKKFGFTPEQVHGMKNPRVVFVPDEALPYDATTFARFNAQEKKSQGKPEAAVKLGKIVPDAVFNNIVNDISRYDRLSDYYADEKAVAQALGALMQAGVINDKQMPELRTGTALSAGGKELLENTLIGKVFQASPDAVRQIISVPTLRQSIVMGLSEIANNRTLSRNGYDLADELAKAVDLVQRAKSSNPDIYVDGMPVSPFGRQAGLFDDEFGDSRVTDATTLLLADILNSGKPSDLRKFLATYNNEASMSASGQADIFTGEIASKEDILTQVNEHFRNATPKEQQALVDNAIAERKRRAAEEQQQRGGNEAGEQTADALQRGAEPQQLNEPTEAQKAAGNYKMEHLKVDGYNVSIENPKGSVRRGKSVDAEGKETPWETTMQNDYGYIRGTQGVDGDHIDVFLSDTPEQGDVFVIDQLDKDGNFDEHKVMYGFPSVEAAREAYLSNYEPGWTGLGAITHVSKEEFKKWIGSSKRKTKPFADYKSVQVYKEQNPVLSVEPDGFSDFGPVFTQFKGNAQGAIKLLSELQDGEAIGALHHKDIGDIDLVWGKAGTAKSDGYGLAKLVKYHPEVVEHLQEILDDMHIVKRSENRINLESDTHKAAVRLTWNKEKKKWLLTAFEKKETSESIDKTTDTDDNPTDLRGDTALSQNSDVSDGKVNTLSADKQMDGAESSEPYTITPTKYEGKHKTSDVWLVKFNRELTAEEKAALDTFIREPLTEGKKTSRGWYDRKQEGYMMRSEEAARQLGEMLGNEEAVADAQPLSREDIKQAAKPAEKPARKKSAPKPANTVTVEDMADESFNDDEVVDALVNHPMFKNMVDNNPDIDAAREMVKKVMDTLRTSYRRDEAFGQKGVNTYLRLTRDTELQKRLEDAAFAKRKPYSPAEPKSEPAPKGQFKVTDEMKAQEAELRKLLGIDDDEGSTDSYFRDPDELTMEEKMKVYSIGINYTFNFLNNGVTAFPDFVKAVVGRLGSKVKPFLKSWYKGAHAFPGYGGEGYTDDADVDRFDVENFDKPSPDAIRDAEMRVAERKAEKAAEKAKKELIAQRNEKRKKDEQQTAADTAALAKEAEAVASEAEATADSAKDERAVADASEKVDKALDKINKQLAILGYFERKGNDPVAIVERKAAEAGADLAARLVDDLGLKLTDLPKGVNVVSADFGEKGGYVRINLPVRSGYEPLRIDIRFDRTGNESLRLTELMTTLKRGDEQSYIIGEDHQAWLSAPTYGELISTIKEQIGKYLPKEEAFEVPEFWHDKTIAELEKMLADVLPKAKSKTGKSFGMDKIARGLSQYIESRKAKEEAPAAPTFPDPKDKEAVSTWLYDNSAAIWKGVDAIMFDARHDENLLNTFRADNTEWVQESVVVEFVDKWISERLEEMMSEHPAAVKAWFDYGQRSLMADVIAERMGKIVAEEKASAKAEETHNGYKIGDEVLWDRYGNGKWEKQRIADFDKDGRPILDSFGQNWITEIADWERIKPADAIFGEAQRVARAEQEKKKKKATADAVATLTGNRSKKSRKKDVTLKPEQPIGDLFGGLFDNPQNSSNHEETEMGTRPGEAGGQRQQLKQDTQVGGDEPRRETERPAGEAGSGSTGMDSDADRTGGRGLHDVATQPALERLPEKERKNVHNNHVERGNEVAPKSESARIKANIAAIETMKKLEASGDAPTAADMKKLRAFSGWGGLGKAFSDWDTSRQLRQLLGDKLYDEGAEMSRNSAYFTPAYIVDAMWDIARAMGFKGGRVLEGSAGIGNVLGLMPQDLSDRSYIRAVEKDPTTGKMLSLLYPDAVVDIDGFEKVKIETGTYDLVITNVPFVPGLKVADTSGDADISKEFKTSIHDFCIAKNVRKLRDGGVGVFITTAGSMDGTGRLYKWLTNRENADIVGMFRMHNETFGGTNATSDIIVVRKRVNGVKSPHAIDCSLTTGVRTAEYNTGETKKVKNVGEVPIIKTLSMSYNRYYVEHPEYMAGEMHFGFEKGDTSFRPESKGLYPVKEKDQSQLLSQWVEDMKRNLADASEETAPTVMNHRDEYVPTYDKVGNEVKTGTIVVDSEGRICVNYDGTARPLMSKLDNKSPKSADERIAQFNKNKVKGRTRAQVVQDYNDIKKALNDLLEYQKASDSDEGLQPKLKALNRAFDSFVTTYGHLHGNNGLAWLKNDVDYPSVIALETYREEGLEHKKVFGKADIFSRRVVVRPEQPKATNVRDGVTLSIRQTGSLDTRYIAEQLGMNEADVRREVIEAGLGYENPLTHSIEAAHEYLSGNVREKMQQAEANNEDGRYTPNITALRKVVPHSIPSHFIEFSIGSSWLRPELFEQYVKERTGASVKLTYAGGMWAMDKPRWTGEQDKSFGIRSEVCDKVITGTELIEAAMTNRTIRVSKQQKDGPTISDPKATSACAAKVDEIRDDFKSWLRSRMEADPELAKEIEERYNNIFNNSAPMTIPDEYIPEYFDGAARVIGGKSIKMRKHQAKAIVRGTMQSLMLAHEVGTGKTFTLITTAMEMRRLGTAKKPMIVVQNATLGQFVASAKALYPDARILSLEDRDRNAEGRKDFYAKIRYNDWDMVVIPQSVLERIPDHPDRERRFIEESIQEKMDVIEAMSKDREAGRAVAALKKDVENLRDQLNKLSDAETAESDVMEREMVTPGSKPKKDGKRAAIAKENAKTRAEEMLNRATDDTLNFDDLGVDAILVDEAHEYKHLGFATAMQRGVKGVDPSYSKKCQGLYLKVKAVQEKSGGRNVIFATGTPISNTAAEVWTFMRYLLPREVMEGHNIWHFDDFVRNFGSIQQMLEFTTQGTYKENNRFAGYSNLPELARIWAGITDTVLTAEAGEVKSQIPELEGGQPTDLFLPQTNGLRAVLKFVRAQLKAYDEMSGQEKKENSHIPLVMYGIAKAAAIDARLVMANAPDDPHSKTNEAVRQTLRSLEDSKAYNGTVAIFADNYQRKNKETGAVEFNLFDDIRTKLIAQGVPAEQVIIMRDGMTDKAKEKIFTKVNAGEIRVILGTTQRLGVGVNIQERLHTLMHIDAPNRPMDYWQRMGRLLRQGNMHKEMGIPVRVIRFGVEDSLDVTAYQRLKTKGAIADAIMHSKDLLANNLENRILEEEGDEFGNITAELSGSQYAMLQNQTEKELRKLQAKQDQHRQHQMYIHRAEPRLRELIEQFSGNIERSDEILALLENNPTTITINGKTYQSREDMQKVFEAHNKAMAAKKQSVQQDEPITSTLTFDIGNVHFTMTTHVSRMAGYGGQGTLAYDVQVQHDVVSHDIDYKRSFGDIPLKRIINELVDNVTSGKEERSNREGWVNAKERNETDLAALLKDKGKTFEHGERIKELEQKLEEYTIAMQEELREKEAKYAEMDANIKDATDITFTSEDDEDSADGEKSMLRDGEDMTDGERLLAIRALEPVKVKRNELSKAELREVYNNLPSVEKNGVEIEFYRSAFKKIYKEGGLFGQVVPVLDEVLDNSVLAYSEEDNLGGMTRPDGTIHKEHPNVDSFDNYVGEVNIDGREYYVRTTVQHSEKSSTGTHSFMVTGIEVYEKTANALSLPITTRARGNAGGEILGESRTIPITSRGTTDFDGIVDAKLQQFFERASSELQKKEMARRVKEMSERMNTPVRILRTSEEIQAYARNPREAKAKGISRIERGGSRVAEIAILLPNNTDLADVENTFLHEGMGHDGLRLLFPTEKLLNNALDELYNASTDAIKADIDARAKRMYDAEVDRIFREKQAAHENVADANANYYTDMAEAHAEANAKREQMKRDATEEYGANVAGKVGEKGFEKMTAEEQTFWGKMKAMLQKAFEALLRGLKIPKMRKWTDKQWAYIYHKAYKMKKANGRMSVIEEAEDITMRRKTGYDADERTMFRDPDMSLEETITKMKAEIMQANTDNLQAKRDAMRAIGGNLNHLRQAMARQREYDITTVKSVTDLAKILMDAGLLDDMSKFETKRILGAVNNVVGKQDVSQYVQKVMDIMVDNQLRNGAGAFGKLLAIRGSRVDARGIEVQGELDPDGQRIAQVVRKSTSLPKDDIDNRIAEAINRMSSTDQAIADEATLEYAGLQIARQYVEDITESKAEEKALRDSIKQAKEDKDAGQMTDDAYKQYVESTNDAIRQNKIERAEAYQSLIEQMGDALSASVERAKAWREAEKQRVEEIHHNANSDMEGRPTDEHHKDDRVQKLSNNSFVRFMLAPLGTFDQMLRMFGKKNVRGEGYLWNRYMRGWVEAAEKEYTGYRDALKVLDAKVSEIYGKKMTWGDLFAIDRKLPKASVRFWDGGEMKDHELTQGNLLYIYMADKMSDGRMKLRRMGITEDDIENIKDFLDPKFIQLADWMQEEFLVGKRNEYNEVHKRMFGASMAAIENYFPLKILANARLEDVDVADDTTDTALPATSTGSIIKRRRNNLALDVTGANAFSVILDHLQQMERWAAFAEFNRDLNTLLSYKRFRNQVMNMSSGYGAGKTLWKNFRNVCSMAAGAYRPPIAALDKAAVNIAKGVTAAKVSFRVFTALKQFLSMPAYLSDSNPLYLAANIANPYGAWKWSMENLPLFEKRWRSRMAGDPRLLKSDMDWKMWRSRVVEIASRVGMSPNAFVDALTVAIGSHAIYQSRLAGYKRKGYDPDVAEERAKQDATILFNQTQQSSEGAFLSTMQVDRSWLSVLFTVFRNSSMSYTRQLYDSLRSLKRYMTPGNKALSVEFMAKQMWRDGIDPDKATANAKREYRRNIIRDLARVDVFGFALQLAWNMGAYLPYLLMGDDESEKDKMWDDILNHTYFGSIEGLTGGDVMSSAGQMWLNGEGNWEYLAKDMPLASDLATILRKMPNDQKAAVNDILNLLVQSGVGVNPQSLTDIVVATMDYFGDDAQTSREFGLLMARIINCPQSQIDKLYFDELGASAEEASKMTPSQIAERYARYKIRRGAPLTGWAYGSEEREQIMEKYRKRSNTLAKERLTRVTDKAVSDSLKTWDEEYKTTKDRVSAIRKVRERDEDRYYEMLDELEATPEFDRYQIITDYKRDVDELTKEWLRAKTPEQRDSCAKAIVNLKKLMITDLRNTQQ